MFVMLPEVLQYFLDQRDKKHPFCLYSGSREGYSYVGFNPQRICRVYPRHLEIDGNKILLNKNQNPFDLLEELFSPHSSMEQDYFKEGWLGFWAYEMASFADESFPKRDLPEDFLLGWWGYYQDVKHWEGSCPFSLPKSASLEKLVAGKLWEAPSRVTPSSEKLNYFFSLSKILSYIEAGDCYQVNFSQRFEMDCPPDFDAPTKFLDLLQKHPAPFTAYLDCGEKNIISLSPEEFLSIHKDRIHTSPIKGTRPRGLTKEEDESLVKDLENSEKEKAELLMIVDLERNDLGKVCESGTIKVDSLRKIETYDYVHHAVAEVAGKIKKGVTPLQATRALFPGGSITGAPKRRAMEIIQELETEARGIYTGTIGFYDVSGFTRLNIAIRSMEIENGKIRFGMGGGIVADSEAEKEYEELFVKAKVFLG